MKNIGRKLISSVCALALVVNGLAGVMAQNRKKDTPVQTVATIVEKVAVTDRRSDGGAPRAPKASDSAWQSADSAFQFFSQEKSFDDRLVTGAPFSADVASETIQTLQDGTRIVQRFEGRIYRDSRGRTRSERTYQMIRSMARITDSIPTPEPVANGLTLNLRRRLSHRRLFLRAHRLTRRTPGREMRRE
jgi:hypothetical protein